MDNNNIELVTTKEQKLEAAGLTRESAYIKIAKLQSAQVMTLDKFGGEHFADDNPTQLRATEMQLKMIGDIRPETVIDNRVVNISGISNDVVTGLLHMVKDVADQLRALKVDGRQTGEIIDVEVN